MSNAPDSANDHPELTFREQAVEDELDDHDRRISRVEKGLLIAVGYVVAEQNMILETAIGVVL